MCMLDFVAALSCDDIYLYFEQCLVCYCSVLGVFKITATLRYKCYVGIREGVKEAHVFL